MPEGSELIPGRATARRAAFRLATSDRVERLVVTTPPLRAMAYRRATRYVAGVDADAALATADALQRDGLSASIDLFGENATADAEAERETSHYLQLVQSLTDRPGIYVSLDASHLRLDDDPAGCQNRIHRIASALPVASRLQLGAEESMRTDATLDVAYTAARDGLPIMVTVQANLRRSAVDIENLARAHVPVRLVKGAYVEREGVAHPWGAETDAAFVRLARRLEELGADHSLATHDPAILALLLASRDGAVVEFLYGVRSDHARSLAQRGHDVRIYVPYGERWFRYYARRAAEAIGS
jgi:proline dehydrogenase